LGKKEEKILVGFSGFSSTDATLSDSRVGGDCEAGEFRALARDVGRRDSRCRATAEVARVKKGKTETMTGVWELNELSGTDFEKTRVI
jgi:hypothetical protein